MVGSTNPAGTIGQTARRRALLGVQPRWGGDFDDLSHEWRRLFAEGLGTFLLVLVAAGGPVVSAFSHGAVSQVAYVSAPGLMVMAVILFMGLVSGAHLNPVVSIAFALRHEFPWKRLPGYLAAQVVGSVLACLLLWALVGKVGMLGATEPGRGISDLQAMGMEAALTLGLVSTILGTASGAQNVGTLSALAVGGYIALAGLWSSPISGASMNPVRSFGPDLVIGDFAHFWVYLVGPLLGALLAVAAAHVLRGRGGDVMAARAAQGTLDPIMVGNGPPPPGRAV
ncbi:MAG: MIP/aquaporin family protein [Candidatus Dormibacteria bacterium]